VLLANRISRRAGIDTETAKTLQSSLRDIRFRLAGESEDSPTVCFAEFPIGSYQAEEVAGQLLSSQDRGDVTTIDEYLCTMRSVCDRPEFHNQAFLIKFVLDLILERGLIHLSVHPPPPTHTHTVPSNPANTGCDSMFSVCHTRQRLRIVLGLDCMSVHSQFFGTVCKLSVVTRSPLPLPPISRVTEAAHHSLEDKLRLVRAEGLYQCAPMSQQCGLLFAGVPLVDPPIETCVG
jgi:hypothetical protein